MKRRETCALCGCFPVSLFAFPLADGILRKKKYLSATLSTSLLEYTISGKRSEIVTNPYPSTNQREIRKRFFLSASYFPETMTDRLDKHLQHIREDVVPQRGTAQQGLSPAYLTAVEARAQPPLLVRGIEQWNEGRFYDQHETLEFLWRATDEPVRDAFKGIIQSGVGAYHVLNHNRRGALGKWTGALGYLAPFVGSHPYGIDITGLREQIHTAREALLADSLEGDWDDHEERARELVIEWERRPADPTVTGVLGYIDRCWSHPRTGLEAALQRITPELAAWVHPLTKQSVLEWVLWTGREKADVLKTLFDTETEPVDPATEWRLIERWVEEVHQTLRAQVGFHQDDRWQSAQSEAISTVMLNDEYAAAEIGKIVQTLGGG